MKKYFKNIDKWQVLSALLFVLAVISGGGGMAMATQIGDEGTDNTDHGNNATNPADDPVDPDDSDRQIPGGKYAGQNLDGTQASATQMRDGELEDDEREEQITLLYPQRTPFLKILSKVSKKRNVKGYIVKHARVGGETLDGTTTAAISAGATVTLTKQNFSGNLRSFRKNDTIAVPSMGGYVAGSQSAKDGNCLMLEVMEVTKTGVTLQAINGPAATANEVGDEYDYQTVPAIASGTYMLGMSNAMSESQLLVTPENYQPREREVYLQKRGWNVMFTEDFKTMKKKYPLAVADLLADASVKNDMRKERSYFLGVKAKRKRTTEDGAVEDVFYSEGLIPQIPNFYAIGSTYYLSDLVAINKLQFTDFATSNRAFVICGKNAIERLENLNPGSNREIHFTVATEFDLTFKRFKDTFGELNFIYDQTMDFMGMSDYMLVLDMDNACHYVKEGKKVRENDMSKGAGDIRLAKRHIEYEADAVALKGYNSIIVGPESDMFNKMSEGIINWIVSSNVLPSNPTANMKIALTSDYTSGGTTYEKGKVYMWDATLQTPAWVEYTGYDNAS